MLDHYSIRQAFKNMLHSVPYSMPSLQCQAHFTVFQWINKSWISNWNTNQSHVYKNIEVAIYSNSKYPVHSMGSFLCFLITTTTVFQGIA